MPENNRTVADLKAENASLRQRLDESEETLRAIRSGEIDALVISTPDGERVYTLKGAERPYRVLLDTMSEGAITIEPGGGIVYCNAEFAAILGRPLKTIVGTQLDTHVARSDASALPALFAACAEEKRKVEFSLINAYGQRVPVQLSCGAIDFDGTKGFSIVVTDLTQHKRNEEIVASEKLATSILDQAGEAIVVCDQSGRMTRASRIVQQLCGGNPLLRNFDVFWKLQKPDGSFSFAETLHGAVVRNQEVVYRRDDGRTFSLLLNATPLHGEKNEIVGGVVTLTDVTELKQTVEALRNAKEAAESANWAKSQFLANMSHEIRTPMTGVMGMVELALEERPGENVTRYLNRSLSAAKSLLRILNDVLDTTKIEAGKLEIVKKPVGLRGCVTSAFETLSTQIEQKNLKAYMTVAPGVPEVVETDEIRLRQILVNLIGNAAKFTHNGEIEVHIEPAREQEGLLFSVRDNGIGIPNEKLEEIFEAFTQVDISDTRKYGGTGLGLTLCRQLVKLMGGSIWVESSEGAGSTFTFFLPITIEAELPGEENFCAAAAAEKRPHKILVAEDDALIAEMLTLLLLRKGFSTLCAGNGQEAVEQWGRDNFDVLLMDIQMPVMDGFDAVSAIREKEKETGRPHTPIIALTARAMVSEEETILSSGFDDYISKPINFKTFYSKLEKYCASPHQ